MLVKVILALAIPAVCQAFIFDRDQSNWNGLKVTWGLNPLSSFQDVPRTLAAAKAGGWVDMAPGVGCNDHANFKGKRYWKDQDLAVILIFDPAGYIAGMQAGIKQDYPTNPNGYPFDNLKNKPFVLDNGIYFVTTYFVNPASLCTGRTPAMYMNEGTGTGLWIQNGTNPVHNSVQVPAKQSDVDQTAWSKGACFVSMGVHYWYATSKTMDCNNFFPVFLLYNNGVLNAFGWAFAMNLENYSHRIEHPPQNSYGNFFNDVPDCLAPLGTMTTMHIYLTNRALLDTC